MHWQPSSRRRSTQNPISTGAVWLLLLTIVLSAFASPRGLCCEAPHSGAASCCPDLVNMPAMHSGSLAVYFAKCASDALPPDFVLTAEKTSAQTLLRAHGSISALAASSRTGLLLAAAFAPLSAATTPRKLPFCDPLSVALRI